MSGSNPDVMTCEPTHSCALELFSKRLLAHDNVSKVSEFVSAKWFCHVVSDHIVRGTVHNGKVAFGNLIGEKEISNIDGSGALTGAPLAILLKEDGTLVVLA